ncbi:MAG: hypothetical protein ACREMS_08700 [Gemmatimonadaceae bacterium]
MELNPTTPISAVFLNIAQRTLIRDAMESNTLRTVVSRDQRKTIRDLCEEMRNTSEQAEDFLIVFKAGLFEVANEMRIPVGEARQFLFAHLVSVLIEEWYDVRRKPVITVPIRDGKSITLTTADLENFPDAHP